MTLRAVACLCLLSTLAACHSRRSDPPPEIIRIPQYVPLPAGCSQIPPLAIEDGATTEELERVLYEHILQLRAQIRACRTTPAVTHD
jgi:hypothetical protein